MEAPSPEGRSRTRRATLRLRIRIESGREIALGPGKADLLEAIRTAGTIADAARGLRMSYMRAWTLVRTMNRCFKAPLVETQRGGTGRGAAVLTPSGRRVLALYRRIEREGERAIAASWRALRHSLKGRRSRYT